MQTNAAAHKWRTSLAWSTVFRAAGLSDFGLAVWRWLFSADGPPWWARMISGDSICNSRGFGDGAEKSGRPDVSRFSAEEASTNEPVARGFNGVLEQIALDVR